MLWERHKGVRDLVTAAMVQDGVGSCLEGCFRGEY